MLTVLIFCYRIPCLQKRLSYNAIIIHTSKIVNSIINKFIFGGFMTEKELKGLNRRELLELLIIQSKKIDRLQAELEEKNQKLASRDLEIKESGSIAEASIRINNVFTNAQIAAEQYLENVHNLHAVTEQECQKLREDTEAECMEMKQKAQLEAEQYLRNTIQMIDTGISEFTDGLKRLADMSFNKDQIKKIAHGDNHEENKE